MSRRAEIRRVAGNGCGREADARVVVAAWQESGDTIAAFGRRHGIDRQRLARWLARLETTVPAAVQFHVVRLAGTGSMGAHEAGTIEIELELAGGRRVRLCPGFEAEDLRPGSRAAHRQASPGAARADLGADCSRAARAAVQGDARPGCPARSGRSRGRSARGRAGRRRDPGRRAGSARVGRQAPQEGAGLDDARRRAPSPPGGGPRVRAGVQGVRQADASG